MQGDQCILASHRNHHIFVFSGVCPQLDSSTSLLRAAFPLIFKSIAHHRVHPMTSRTEASQLHLLPIPDLLCITISPLNWYIGVGIRIHKHVECTVPIQHWKECDRCCYLSEDSLNLFLYLRFGLLRRRLPVITSPVYH